MPRVTEILTVVFEPPLWVDLPHDMGNLAIETSTVGT